MDFSRFVDDGYDRMGSYRALLLKVLYAGVGDPPDLASPGPENWRGRFCLVSDVEALARNLHEAVLCLSFMICDAQQRAAGLEDHAYDELGYESYDKERVIKDLQLLGPDITRITDLTTDAHEQMFLYRTDPYYVRPEGSGRRSADKDKQEGTGGTDE